VALGRLPAAEDACSGELAHRKREAAGLAGSARQGGRGAALAAMAAVGIQIGSVDEGSLR